MANYELVSKIAHLRKISTSFVDYQGKEAAVPFDNIELILSAMGYDLEDETKLAHDAWQLDTHQWNRLLEPITVLSPLRHLWGINIYVKNYELGQTGHWLISCEAGELLEGSFNLDGLNQTGDYWMGHIQHLRRVLPLPSDLPLGYHQIKISVGESSMTSPLIVTPKTSYHCEAMQRGDKTWGTAIQLYTLRSETNWGMGDFGDLGQLMRDMAGAGADVIGLNPIHALYPISPDHCSPYSPSDRSFLNVLYTDIPQVPEFAESPALRRKVTTKTFAARVAALRASDDVHYAGVSALKFEFFEQLFSVFCKNHLGKGTARDEAFKDFVRSQGEPLRLHVVFDALLAHFKSLDINAWGWPVWPEAYQDYRSQAVVQFAVEHQHELNYWTYLQFIADEQLQNVNQLAKDLGMKIGLYRDLAVGADRGGAEVWSNQENFCLSAAVGAPPDALGPNGQNWGLPPLDPIKLKQEGYQTFITLLRNNMRACGALRIDHALALLRLWWCPPGKTAAFGAYVYYDMFDLLGILNLESQRNQCMVIAEDLGTVPEEVTEFFPQAELYSNKVFYFEMNGVTCTEPDDYAIKALAIVCNHDMPTVKAFWNKSDLNLRKQLNMFAGEDDFLGEQNSRENAKRLILAALAKHGRLPTGISLNPTDLAEMTQELCFAIHKQLAASRSQIVAIQLEDMMMINKPVNIPGTSHEYPNWRRKLDISSQDLFAQAEIQQFCQEINRLRQP
ncbi:4-alpha-glucanotransferase [Reinekea sp.]|jgi:4-alpha-glucanotransferase|uniref:4-alpha-glucanotransferase n=1 Tax=Reinekea sp. TaxID=1970455 RepID=UPI002A81DA5E|nr:4-alpha-glucanotransferase [Reinekea sp.]